MNVKARVLQELGDFDYRYFDCEYFQCDILTVAKARARVSRPVGGSTSAKISRPVGGKVKAWLVRPS